MLGSTVTSSSDSNYVATRHISYVYMNKNILKTIAGLLNCTSTEVFTRTNFVLCLLDGTCVSDVVRVIRQKGLAW